MHSSLIFFFGFFLAVQASALFKRAEPCNILIISPNSSTTWTIGETVDVTWNQPCNATQDTNASSTVVIDLLSTTTPDQIITLTSTNADFATGKTTITVSGTNLTAGSYRLFMQMSIPSVNGAGPGAGASNLSQPFQITA